MTEENNKTLNNNNVRNFILRIDSLEFTSEVYSHLISEIQHHFDRTEVQSAKQIKLNAAEKKTELSESEHKEYKLISSKYSSSLTLSEVSRAIHIQCNNYIDYTSYIDTIRIVIENLKKLETSCSATRIGMRFINEFKCSNKTQLKKVFNKRQKSVVNNMLQRDFCSRAVAIEEYTYPDMKSRVQYGVINKFYPAAIVNYDASLDIDVFDDGSNDIEHWEEILKNLNHMAYELFKDTIDEKTVSGMK